MSAGLSPATAAMGLFFAGVWFVFNGDMPQVAEIWKILGGIAMEITAIGCTAVALEQK